MKHYTEESQDLMDELGGRNVFVRGVTYHYTGRLVGSNADMIRLDDAAWVASSGRFAEALATGTLDEVEPYPGTVYLNRGAIMDLCEWAHELTRTTQ